MSEISSEVIARCRREMSNYGAAMVKGCVDLDMEAYDDLQQYPKKYQSIVDRCRASMASYGWSMVKGCADLDIEAEEALEDY